MRVVEFDKMHGLGNDFILVDNRKGRIGLRPRDVRFLCRPSFGVGADGVILLERSRRADLRMRVFNSDGSPAEMCGNGIRCLARFALRLGLVKGRALEVETGSGVKQVWIHANRVTVDMGEPVLDARRVPVRSRGRVVNLTRRFGKMAPKITCLSMGNPHCVIFYRGERRPDVAGLGARIERDSFFPRRTNVEFVRVDGPGAITVDVWERGAGRTLACGTGACAAAVAGALLGKTSRQVRVRLPGGELKVEWGDDNHVYLTGPAIFVFSGRASLP